MSTKSIPGDSKPSQYELIRRHLTESAELKLQIAASIVDQVANAAYALAKCFRSGGKVLICGNGGSAADAQHMAAEFVNRLSPDIERPGLPAVAITTDTSFITSYANDIGYDRVFERQVLALGRSGDVLIAISTSGNSKNVNLAVAAARANGLATIGLAGEGGALAEIADFPIVVPSRNTQHVQECFLSLEHVMCAMVEQTLFSPLP
jgi:D-sedoheptulose 7-phosphate isomerase